MALYEFYKDGVAFPDTDGLWGVLREAYPYEAWGLTADKILSDRPAPCSNGGEVSAILYPKIPGIRFYGGFTGGMGLCLHGVIRVLFREHSFAVPGGRYGWTWDYNCVFVLPESFPAVVGVRGDKDSRLFVATSIDENTGELEVLGPSGSYRRLDARHFYVLGKKSLPDWYHSAITELVTPAGSSGTIQLSLF